MPALDNYGVREYKAAASKIEELYIKIVRDNMELLMKDALACRKVISKYGPILSEVPYQP